MNPTYTEVPVLNKFREKVRDLNLQGFFNTDLGLLQWLRARELKVDDADKMLRASLKWREKNEMDSILTWNPPAVFEQLCPVEFCGFDKDNCPMIFFPFGKWDAKKLSKLGHSDTYVKYMAQCIEKSRERAKETFMPSGQPVTQFIYIVDNKGLSLQTLACVGAINMFMETMRVVEANYPETIKKIIVINANRIFTALFAFVKPIMFQRTFGKVDIYNTNIDKWRTALLEHATPDQLPKSLSLSRKNSLANDPSTPTLTSHNYMMMTVGPGEKFPVEQTILKANSVLSWAFSTAEGGIGFSVILDHGAMNMDMNVVPFSIANSHEETQGGVYICVKTGLYRFIFDNTKDKKNQRTLQYRIEVMEADAN